METAYKRDEIAWISVLQGLSMLFVVVGHVQHDERCFPWEGFLQSVIYRFHMPLFMFTSGYLFHLTSHRKGKGFGTVLKDKFRRLVVPYLAFSLATIPLKVAAASYMRRGADFSVQQILDAFVWLTNMPLGEMWFVNALFLLFLLFASPRFSRLPGWLEGVLATALVGLAIAGPAIPSFIFDFRAAAVMAVYFFVGMVLARRLAMGPSRFRAFAVCGSLVFAGLLVLDSRGVGIPAPAFAFAGIAASLGGAGWVAQGGPGTFGWFRNHTYQIFLMGLFPQIALRLVVGRTIQEPHLRIAVLYASSIASALVLPVLVSRAVQACMDRTGWRWLGAPIGLR